jgi:hypothetical protein
MAAFTLENGIRMMIPKPVVKNNKDEMSVQNIYFITQAWASYFLAPMSPRDALKVFQRLLATIPPPLRSGFDFLALWL